MHLISTLYDFVALFQVLITVSPSKYKFTNLEKFSSLLKLIKWQHTDFTKYFLLLLIYQISDKLPIYEISNITLL